MEISMGKIIEISVNENEESIGEEGINKEGIVNMVMVMEKVGIKNEEVKIIINVEWILDSLRKMINVLGEYIGEGIVDNLRK